MRALIGIVAGLVIGVLVGRELPPKPTRPVQTVPVARCPAPNVEVFGRAIAERVEPPSEPAAPTQPVTPEPVAAAAVAASGRAAEILDRAVASGTWTVDDRMALRAVLPDLAPDDRNATFAALARAVNEGRLILSGPPL